MNCHLEIEPDKKTTAVRFVMDGRNAGVLTLTNAEWAKMNLMLIDECLRGSIVYTTETIVDTCEM